MDHRPYELSGGEQQRVAIARALMNDPVLLLADEPTGNLDSETGAGIMTLLLELKQACRLTLIMATHDPQMARQTDRILRLSDGQIALLWKNPDHPELAARPPGPAPTRTWLFPGTTRSWSAPG